MYFRHKTRRLTYEISAPYTLNKSLFLDIGGFKYRLPT